LDVKLDVNGLAPVGSGQQVTFGFVVHPAYLADFLAWPPKDMESAIVVAQVQEFKKSAEDRTISVPLADFQTFCLGTEGAAKHDPLTTLTREQLAMEHCR
jgi:hypothetical protein